MPEDAGVARGQVPVPRDTEHRAPVDGAKAPAVPARAGVVADEDEPIALEGGEPFYEQAIGSLGVGNDDEVTDREPARAPDEEAVAGRERREHARPADLDAPRGSAPVGGDEPAKSRERQDACEAPPVSVEAFAASGDRTASRAADREERFKEP